MGDIEKLLPTFNAAKGTEFNLAQIAKMLSTEDLENSLYPLPSAGDVKITGREAMNILRVIKKQMGVVFQQRDRDFFSESLLSVFSGVFAAKAQLGNGLLGTVTSGADLILSGIRPETVYASTHAGVYTWETTVASAGWSTTYWNIDLSTNYGSSIILQPFTRTCMVVLGVADFEASPKLQGGQWNDTATDLGVFYQDMYDALGNIGYIAQSEALFIGMNKKFTFDANFATAGASSPRPLGVQVSKREYAVAETA